MDYVKYIRSPLWRNSSTRRAKLAASGERSRMCNAAAVEAASLAMPARLSVRTEQLYP